MVLRTEWSRWNLSSFAVVSFLVLVRFLWGHFALGQRSSVFSFASDLQFSEGSLFVTFAFNMNENCLFLSVK